jgi:glycosyltransferase involved in cell wall biosynthesis
MCSAGITIYNNAIKIARRPILSVVVPTLRDDPRALIAIMAVQALACKANVEIIVLDDGSGDGDFADAMRRAFDQLPVPGTFLRLHKNGGRAAARNTLSEHAKGDYLLFLDSDTLPDEPTFLQNYLTLINNGTRAVINGGFSLKQSAVDKRYELHRNIAGNMDCMPADIRNKAPLRYSYGCNFLAPRDIALQHPFSAHYTGWGWEDQEWAVRVSQTVPIWHIDNYVSHLGLDDVDTLLRKYASSGLNFRLMKEDHPELMKTYPAYTAYRVVRWLPARKLLRVLTAGLTRAEFLPLKTRLIGARLYRSLHYAAD